MLRLITFIFLMTASVMSWAYTYPVLVLDMRNAPQVPKNFRSVNETLPNDINAAGLYDLHMAGGAQFSRASFYAILSRLHAKHITVIDLRQESHGMLDNNAVSWYGIHNAANTSKTPEQIEEAQAALLKALSEEKVAKVENILEKSDVGQIKKTKTIEYLVHETSSERELMNALKQHYQRIYVQDFHAPTAAEVDRFIIFARSLPKNNWIYFHCRGGRGRTTMFMTMYDIMHNAKKVSLDDILKRQVALGGKNLEELPAKKNFKYPCAANRLEFVKQFYEYAKNNNDNFKTTWSEWFQSHS